MLSYLIRLLIFENFFKHKERYFCGYKDMEKEEVKNKAKVFRPQAGGQEAFVRSNVDVCFFGGVLNCGKSFGAILSVAEWSKIPRFRAVFTRRNLQDTKAGGGMVDEFKNVYGDSVKSKETDSPRITFPSADIVGLLNVMEKLIFLGLVLPA